MANRDKVVIITSGFQTFLYVIKGKITAGAQGKTFALTEGNPRTDTISGQGTREPIYGRPIYERNTRLVVTYHF